MAAWLCPGSNVTEIALYKANVHACTHILPLLSILFFFSYVHACLQVELVDLSPSLYALCLAAVFLHTGPLHLEHLSRVYHVVGHTHPRVEKVQGLCRERMFPCYELDTGILHLTTLHLHCWVLLYSKQSKSMMTCPTHIHALIHSQSIILY